jgi:hypothetical protein
MKLDIEREVAALQQMSTGQLCERYAELFGERTRTRHRTYLVRKIAWKLQAKIEGDLSERARRRAEELAHGTELRVMPPKSAEATHAAAVVTHPVISADMRLPTPGTAIVRPNAWRFGRQRLGGTCHEISGCWRKGAVNLASL